MIINKKLITIGGITFIITSLLASILILKMHNPIGLMLVPFQFASLLTVPFGLTLKRR